MNGYINFKTLGGGLCTTAYRTKDGFQCITSMAAGPGQKPTISAIENFETRAAQKRYMSLVKKENFK